jgi:hypothetical protein
VQDFERCLRTAGPMNALEKLGVSWWRGTPGAARTSTPLRTFEKKIRDGLHTTLPLGLERREAFIERLNAAVAWANRVRRKEI